MSHPGYISRPAAIVDGWPALYVAQVFRRHPEELLDLPLGLRSLMEDMLADLERAGRAWADEVNAGRGTAEPSRAKPRAYSEVDEPMTTAGAAEVLQVTERQIRKLIAAGTLPATKGRHGWQVDAGAVYSHQEARALGGAA